jgi:hypothetical protein
MVFRLELPNGHLGTFLLHGLAIVFWESYQIAENCDVAVGLLPLSIEMNIR